MSWRSLTCRLPRRCVGPRSRLAEGHRRRRRGLDCGSTQRTTRSSTKLGKRGLPKAGIRKGWHLDVPSAVIAKRAAGESARLPGLSRLGRVPPHQADLGRSWSADSFARLSQASQFFCSVAAPFSCPGHPSPEHRAQLRSRLGAPAPTAQRRGLDRGEHGVTLKWSEAPGLAGSWFFPRSDNTAATWHRKAGTPSVPDAGHPNGAAAKKAGWPSLVPAGTGIRHSGGRRSLG